MGASVNFTFLRQKATELEPLCALAEQYAHSDPESALVKLRTFAEEMVKTIYHRQRFKPVGTVLYDMLKGDQFEASIPDVVRTKFHAIRKEGNKAAHGGSITSKQVIWLLKEAHQLAGWYCVTFHRMDKSEFPSFREPTPTENTAEKNKANEEELTKLVEELATAKAKYEVVEQELSKLKTQQDNAQAAANTLNLTEEETRKRLIDVALIDVGWDVSKNGSNTAEVGQEVEINHVVDSREKGYVDYALWDDNGKPLAVIEAKRTSKSAEVGRKQAAMYADALEKEHGQRPVIFYTNGYDVFMWDDAQGYPPRQLFGFYSKSSLQYLMNFQRQEKKELNTLVPNPEIAGRTYQIETIKRVTEAFEAKKRKALIVQATGTGKTRVSIALTDLLMRANWVKRVLFLCDRRELRKQAKNAFEEHLDVSITIGGGKGSETEKTRVTVATYPGMMKKFQQYDVGHFDLIVADESHRSIYNMYRDLFRYFDCFQVGLTATPIGFINKSTFRMFECDPEHPTSFYPLERAIEEECLVPYEVYTHTTKFLRDGIKYSDLTSEQQQELEENGELPEDMNAEQGQVDKDVLNKDTARHIIRNLMENGIKDATGQTLGKTIIFARNHNHAILLQKAFDELYPQYGGQFTQVIDTYDSRAEDLIDDFKGLGTNQNLTIAISVDMLDTGIDIPEVVNLAFAKPVKSKVKFWQMIGRGTRLCENLFGPGKHKSKFRIFDHWSNFDYFAQNTKEAEPTATKGIRQKLFEIRMALATVSTEQNRKAQFKTFIKLVDADVKSLPQDTISVKEKWRQVQSVLADGVIAEFSPVTVVTLSKDIAPLMRWIDMRGESMAYSFDLLVSHAEYALVKGSSDFEDFKGRILDLVNNLQTVLPQVRPYLEMVNNAKSAEFWEEITINDLEELRKALRNIIKYQHEKTGGGQVGPKVIDITEDASQVKTGYLSSGIKSIDMQIYRQLVEAALVRMFDTDPTLQKIRRGEAVAEAEISQLSSLVLTNNPGVRLELLEEFYPDLAGHLDLVIRSIVGMEKEAVRGKFTQFVQTHPSMTAQQIRFLDMLQSQIAQNGTIKLEALLTAAPFTNFHPEGIDGVFDDKDADEIITIAKQFEFPLNGSATEGGTP